MKYQCENIHSDVLPEGWYMVYSIYYNYTNRTIKSIYYIRVENHHFRYLNEDGSIGGKIPLDSNRQRIAENYSIYRLSEEEIEKHILMEYI